MSRALDGSVLCSNPTIHNVFDELRLNRGSSRLEFFTQQFICKVEFVLQAARLTCCGIIRSERSSKQRGAAMLSKSMAWRVAESFGECMPEKRTVVDELQGIHLTGAPNWLMSKVIVGMIGLGTVGSGVVCLLTPQRHLVLKKIAVRDVQKKREVQPPCELTSDVLDIIDDPEIEILIEVMGGEQPAYEYIQRAISKHKHIVTANKELLAKHGPELFQLARENGVAIFFEASVAGGIPLISTMHRGLEANQISSITGILNGTTNFILSRMEDKGESFDSALSKAQELGFAEADPTNDVEGHDVAYKLSILSALAHGKFVRPGDIYREGIRRVSPEDINWAAEFGYRVKLVGMTRHTDNGERSERPLAVRVHPMLVPITHPLASVSGSNNGIVVVGDAVGELTLVGPGAGQMPTASAVVGDAMNLASALMLPDFATYFHPEVASQWAETAKPGDFRCSYYLRLIVADYPGVIGQIGTIFGSHNISMQSIVQRGVKEKAASVIIVTQDVYHSDMDNALATLTHCNFLIEVGNAIRIFKPESTNAQ